MAGSRPSGRDEIEISDDDITADDSDSRGASDITPTSHKKRKLKHEPEPVDEKVEWTDDSDGAYERLKNRKRRAGVRGRKKKEDKTSKGKGASKADGSKAAEASDPYDEVDVPDYIRQRRRDFDRNHDTLTAAGLLLPPDYSDIAFSDDERLASLQEKPKFEERSGIKPSREYKDVELEYSAGLIPASIAQYLRDYQIVGVKFLHQLFVYQKGGILGDDMGLGKTVQVAAFLTAAFGKTGDERDAKRMRKMRRAGDDWYPRVLIVCPGSLIENWKNELNRWGYWHIDLYHGPGKEEVLQTARAGRLEIMITTYVTYKNHKDSINTVQWDAVVADECHQLKDRKSGVTKAMNEVNSLCRIGLTGTAIQNKYEELWTLLNWTNPGNFGSIAEWRKTISIPLTIGQSHDATLYQLSRARKTAKKLVQNLLPTCFLRRMKTLIAHQLPKKSDKVVFCPLTDIQRDAYERFCDSEQACSLREISEICDCGSHKKKGWCCQAILSNGKPWQAVVFPTILTLQKLSNHLTLLIPGSSEPGEKQQSELKTLQTCLPNTWESLYRKRDSLINLANPSFCGKWRVLKRLLGFWHENGDKVLVFSHSVRLLNILKHLFNNTSYNVSYLDGSLSYEERQQTVDDFNSDPTQFVFLISTKAGGVGLNITSANKVVIFDPHWNPAYDLQAQDRAYRIGQVRDVDVFRLISAGTIEEIVYARQIYKQQQANIGYNASSERRYFKGVQQNSERKGEIFGLDNLLAYRPDQVVLRDIVNKTNVAEAKAGVALSDIDLDKVVKDEDTDLSLIKKEEDIGSAEDGGMSQLADFLTAENQQQLLKDRKANRHPKSDAIQAILSSVGVEYTHENSEVVGSSRVEAQLSRRAELVQDDEWSASGGEGAADHSTARQGTTAASDAAPEGGSSTTRRHHRHSALFADTQANDVAAAHRRQQRHLVYRPPHDVMSRQFCSMAREFGFASATDFALVAESWTQEQRRNCLDAFYKRREARVAEMEGAGVKKEEGPGGDGDVKIEQQQQEEEDVDGVPKMKEEDAKVKREVLDGDQAAASLVGKVKAESEGAVKVKVKEEEAMVQIKQEPKLEDESTILIDDDVTEDGMEDLQPETKTEIKTETSADKMPLLDEKPMTIFFDDDDDETDEL